MGRSIDSEINLTPQEAVTAVTPDATVNVVTPRTPTRMGRRSFLGMLGGTLTTLWGASSAAAQTPPEGVASVVDVAEPETPAAEEEATNLQPYEKEYSSALLNIRNFKGLDPNTSSILGFTSDEETLKKYNQALPAKLTELAEKYNEPGFKSLIGVKVEFTPDETLIPDSINTVNYRETETGPVYFLTGRPQYDPEKKVITITYKPGSATMSPNYQLNFDVWSKDEIKNAYLELIYDKPGANPDIWKNTPQAMELRRFVARDAVPFQVAYSPVLTASSPLDNN